MKRYNCTCCQRKRNENKVRRVYYPLIRQGFWHCIECIDSRLDDGIVWDFTNEKKPFMIDRDMDFIDKIKNVNSR